MEQQTLQKLVESYKHYDGAVEFIAAANESLHFRDSKSRKSFIENTFRNNQITDIRIGTIRRLIAHWQNVARDKLLVADYQNYSYTQATLINFRIVCHFIENN